MKKSSLFYITISCLLFGAPLYFFKGPIACEMTGQLGYEEVHPRVFMATSAQIDSVDLSFLALGSQRVVNTFGDTVASPTIIITATAQESNKFFSSETASSHFSPFNNCLVLGPKGQNADVFAHELVHSEIYARLGWLTQVLEMPRWFEEGVSLLVDLREPFLPENISLEQTEIEAVKSLFYGHQFYSENAFTNYQAARLAVDSIDKDEFYINLERIKRGQDFDDVFGI